MDPFSVLLESRWTWVSENILVRNLTFVVGWACLQWFSLEGIRICAIILVSLMTYCDLYINIVSQLQSKFLGETLIHLNNQPDCINQIGQTAVRNIAGILMSCELVCYYLRMEQITNSTIYYGCWSCHNFL